jgi:hypothetical protein
MISQFSLCRSWWALNGEFGGANRAQLMKLNRDLLLPKKKTADQPSTILPLGQELHNSSEAVMEIAITRCSPCATAFRQRLRTLGADRQKSASNQAQTRSCSQKRI